MSVIYTYHHLFLYSCFYQEEGFKFLITTLLSGALLLLNEMAATSVFDLFILWLAIIFAVFFTGGGFLFSANDPLLIAFVRCKSL